MSMTFAHANGLRYFTFESFPHSVTHAVFTRSGGVSPSPWNSLNVGGTVGDDPARVLENRTRSFAAARRSLDSMYDVWQVHSADAVMTDTPRRRDQAHQKADIMFTSNPAVTLYMRFADCVPILLHDPRRAVVGIVHAGWLGTVRGAARAAARAMIETYGSRPADILAGIGPSIGVDHYEVGADVVAKVEDAFTSAAGQLVQTRGGRTYLDLWKCNELQLRSAGVEHVEVAGLCTACHLEDWYSHRAEKGRTGRFGALIALTQ
jgi:YfiH family protein